MSESLGRLQLHEEELTRGRKQRGVFLLVPWMLIGTLWLRLNTGLDPGVVDFYIALLQAGALALVLGMVFEPKFGRDLTSLKLLPFILLFLLLFVGMFIAFSAISYASNGDIMINKINGTEFANFLGLTILIVAPVETLVFQYVIPKLATLQLRSMDESTPKGFRLSVFGGMLSQLTFGGFHYVAYNHDVGAMLMAVVLGIGFYALVRLSPVWGLGAAMGAHAGWNVAVSVFNVQALQDVLFGALAAMQSIVSGVI